MVGLRKADPEHACVDMEPPRISKPGHSSHMCILSSFTQRDRDGTGKEEASRQENHFCQTSQKDGKRQKAPQVRRHSAPEGSDPNLDASGVLTTPASRSRQAISAWPLACGSSDPVHRPTPRSAASPYSTWELTASSVVVSSSDSRCGASAATSRRASAGLRLTEPAAGRCRGAMPATKRPKSSSSVAASKDGPSSTSSACTVASSVEI